MNLLKTPWIGAVSFVHMLPVSSRCKSDRCEVMINTTASQKLQLPLTLPTPQFMTDFCTLVSLFRILYVKLQQFYSFCDVFSSPLNPSLPLPNHPQRWSPQLADTNCPALSPQTPAESYFTIYLHVIIPMRCRY